MSKQITTNEIDLLEPSSSINWCVRQISIYFWYGTTSDGQCRVQAKGVGNQILAFEDINNRKGQEVRFAKKLQELFAFIGAIRNSTDVVDLTAEIAKDSGSSYLYRLSAWDKNLDEVLYWDFRDIPPNPPTTKHICPNVEAV